ncbi:MAG: hypothetical protein A2Y77_17250 [Planctomycetes bacterium RBG_13_62_9]|nr:MAG: hypothetical protein A2Y77_17250 [Planctomycetes bacterium RBG_13_62_9]
MNALPTEDGSTEVTQQKAANAEESASASEELSAHAESMKEIVSQPVAVVGGAANATQRVVKRGLGHGNASVDHGPSRHTVGTPAKDKRFGKSDGAFHEIAKASDKNVERAQRSNLNRTISEPCYGFDRLASFGS